MIEKILEERGKNYGDFIRQSGVSQSLKACIRTQTFDMMPEDMKEALELILMKVARIVCGNPAYADSWQDIIGYAQLVLNSLNNSLEKK